MDWIVNSCVLSYRFCQRLLEGSMIKCILEKIRRSSDEICSV